ncbi:hypothetical protein JW887_04370, partial [Candidatus Dojkabacteria bacterium]|nr:hypothetical protein [Candidatus Dojkabacteria bacterium]
MKSLHQFISSSIVILLIFQVGTINGQMTTQEIVPPSPDAAQIGIFGNFSIGLHTGAMQYGISLYTFETSYLNLKLTLNYNTNGLIVDKVSSWVGYDWNLEAGGLITTTVRGQQDFQRGGRKEVPEGLENQYNLLDFLSLTEGYDLEPDIYSFNFGNYSGRFFLSADLSTVYTIPFQNLKIDVIKLAPTSKAVDHFVITAPDGNKYTFSSKEITTTMIKEYSVSYTSTWFLSSIIHPTGDEIKFHYMAPIFTSVKTGVNQYITRNIGFNNPSTYCNGTDCPHGSGISINSINHQIIYLDSITSNYCGRIIFRKSGQRSDYPGGMKLDSIIIKNQRNETIKNIEFGYQMLNSTMRPPNFVQTITSDMKTRLFLKYLKIRDKNGSILENYGFDYNNMISLPTRLSLSQDHWGYYNGKSNYDLIPQGEVPSYYSGLFPVITANREPDGQFSKYGTLCRIDYPTGGYSLIDYEPQHDGTKEVGGCRVKRISSYASADAEPTIKRYFYNTYLNTGISYGLSQGIPEYFYTHNKWINCYRAGDGVIQIPATCMSGTLVSNSLLSMFSGNQNSIVYPTISISYGENFEAGGEQHSFDVVFDSPGTVFNTSGGPIYPLPYNDRCWYSGTKSAELIFRKSETGQFKKVKQTNYHYDREDSRNKTEYKCMAIINRIDEKPHYPDGDPPLFDLKFYDVVSYSILSVWDKPSYTTTANYDDSGNELSTVTTYYYDNATHAQLSRESTTNSKGETVLKKYYYPHDYATSLFNIVSLKDSFILN